MDEDAAPVEKVFLDDETSRSIVRTIDVWRWIESVRNSLRNGLIGKRFVSILTCRGGTHMDADDLRIVDAVARIGGMNRAATELNMVQSNVTSRIRLLEEELGVQLFVRHSRGVVPSEAGLCLFSYGEQIHALFEQAITAVKEDGTPKGKLRIGMMETTAGLRLPALIA